MSVANLMANFEMVAANFWRGRIWPGKERQIHWASSSDRSGNDEFQEISSTIAHELSPARVEGSNAVAVGTSPVTWARVRSRYQKRIVPMENKRISVEIAF